MIKKEYKAYEIEIVPSHNTQESYDSVVVPFLELDDIGIEVQVDQPHVTSERLDLKPEFQNQVAEVNEYNTRIASYNSLILKIFDKVKSAFDANKESTNEDIIATLQKDVSQCNHDLNSTVQSMIDKLREFSNSRSHYDDYDYDDYYDILASAPDGTIFMKPNKSILDEWYDYRYKVDFNDSAKLHVKCHEGTKTYRLIHVFIQTIAASS